MTELDPQVEQQLAALSSEDFAALVARVRPPSFTDQLKAAASRFISGERLDAFVAGANLKAFAYENGDIDEAKVAANLTTLFGQPGNGNNGSGYRDWGQHGAPRSDQHRATKAGPKRRPAPSATARLGLRPGAEALRRMTSGVENAGAAEARRRAAQRGSVAGGREQMQENNGGFGAGGRAEAARRRGITDSRVNRG
jgi:hypothetical protein